MKVIITGASGFIGSAVAQRLETAGHEVLRVRTRYWEEDGLPAELEAPCDVLIHAAWAGVQAKYRGDGNLQQSNVSFFKQLMQNCSRHPPGLFIGFGSQAEIYPPISEYGLAKLDCARLLHDFSAKHFRSLWLRLFSVYGPGESSEWFIPSTISKLVRNEAMELTPGEQELDYLHVDDVAAAVAMAMSSTVDGIYEIGSGTGVPLKDVVMMLKQLTGSTSELRFGALPYRPGQVMQAKANPLAFMDATAWVPMIELKSGLAGLVRSKKGEANG